MTRLRVTRDAVSDRREILACTQERFESARARGLRSLFEAALDRIEMFPGSGRRRPDLEVDATTLQAVNVGRVFLIVYEIRGEDVVVIRILHGARDLESELGSDRPSNG